jgi:hypothetical protein
MFNVSKTDFNDFVTHFNESMEYDGDVWNDEYKEEYEGATFYRICYDKDEVAFLAVFPENFLDTEYLEVCGVITSAIKKHIRNIKECGVSMLDILGREFPLIASANSTDKRYGKFLEYLGFERYKTLDFSDENGIIYNRYVRK